MLWLQAFCSHQQTVSPLPLAIPGQRSAAATARALGLDSRPPWSRPPSAGASAALPTPLLWNVFKMQPDRKCGNKLHPVLLSCRKSSLRFQRSPRHFPPISQASAPPLGSDSQLWPGSRECQQRVALSRLPAELGSTVHAHCGDRSTRGTETQALPNPKSSIAVLSRLTLLLHFLLKPAAATLTMSQNGKQNHRAMKALPVP